MNKLFSASTIAFAVERLRLGQVDYSGAMFAIMEKRLTNAEKGRLQRLILNLDR